MIYNPKYENSHALLIGINNYDNVSPLKYACSDADAVAKILADKFSFTSEGITLLKDKHATKENILKAFHGFTQDKTEPDDKLIIFFAGHGHTITGNRGEVGFLVPVDGRSNDTSTLIRWDELTRNAEIVRAKHVLFIMDACYGGLAITRAPAIGSRRFLKDMCQRYARQVVTAGKADESVADAGGPLPDHSIFTGYLLQGLNGSATTDEGIITANGVMAYVYEKVGNDPNSHQTPHYGYIEGDGDFIFTEEPLQEISAPSEKDKDLLIEVPSTIIEFTPQLLFSQAVKEYISDPSKKIILHDTAMGEVRKCLSLTSREKMPLQINPFAEQQIIERYKSYEDITKNLKSLFTILSYWGGEEQITLLEHMLKRLTDNNGCESGLTTLLKMRWYPVCMLLYTAGISALAAKKYGTLLRILSTTVDCKLDSKEPEIIVPCFQAMVGIHDTFKFFPGHGKYLVPRSEYLFKLIQPQLDEILFLGQSYESLFDRFEIFLALVYADVTNREWGPLGRFGYKHSQGHEELYGNLLNEAESQKDNWPPIKAGLFGGSYKRFERASKAILELINKVHWW